MGVGRGAKNWETRGPGPFGYGVADGDLVLKIHPTLARLSNLVVIKQ